MFGNNSTQQAPEPAGPSAANVARLTTQSVHVFVFGPSAADMQMFVNGKPQATGSVDSVSVDIAAPDDSNPEGTISGVLAFANGQPSLALFPGTVDIYCGGRRLTVSCAEEGQFDGLWLGLGLKPDGTSSELSGVQALRLAVSPGLAGAKLIWGDTGRDEDVFAS